MHQEGRWLLITDSHPALTQSITGNGLASGASSSSGVSVGGSQDEVPWRNRSSAASACVAGTMRI